MEFVSIFILLIPLDLALIFLALLGTRIHKSPEPSPWQGEFLIALTIWGGLIIVITELLSLFSWINRVSIALTWGLIGTGLLVFMIRNGSLRRGWSRLKASLQVSGWFEWLLVTVFGLYIGLLFLIAVVAPSNNVDALQYHLPRALHWQQNGSLQHYAVARIAQNIRPYWAEVGILHLRALWGDDGPAQLVQWFSMVASIIGATGIAAILGGKDRRPWLTAVFALTIPMGVLQASTAQNDYAAALWVVVLVYFVLLSRKRELHRIELTALAFALATGMLTKGTFFPYAAPLAAWFFLGRLKDVGLRRVFLEGLFVTGVVVVLNSGFWIRNVRSYGGLYGNEIPVEVISARPTGELAPRFNDGVSSTPDGLITTAGVSSIPLDGGHWTTIGPEWPGRLWSRFVGWLATVLQMIAMNFVTPIRWVNLRYFDLLLWFGGPFTPEFVGSLDAIVWNHEHLAGSPLHLLGVFAASLYWWLRGLRAKPKLFPTYAAISLLGFSMVGLIGYATTVYSIRYQLAYLLMGAPLVGIALERMSAGWIQKGVMVGMLVYAMPYLLISNLHPVIGLPPWPTKVGSVFTADPAEIIFALNPGNRDEYERVVELIEGADCKEIGLWLGSDDLEYSFWWLLDAPQSGVELRFIRTEPQLEKFLDSDFKPCAVICSRCQGMESVDEVPLIADYGQIQLFLEE